MKTIWKFPLYEPEQTIDAPGLGRLLTAAMQGPTPMLWAEVDTDLPSRHTVISVLGTGFRVDDDTTHVATLIDGSYVWHVYATEPVE